MTVLAPHIRYDADWKTTRIERAGNGYIAWLDDRPLAGPNTRVVAHHYDDLVEVLRPILMQPIDYAVHQRGSGYDPWFTLEQS